MRFIRFFLAICIVLLLTAPAVTAGNTCTPVRGVAQQQLFGDYMRTFADTWSGPVQLVLGNNEILVGTVYENDGNIVDPQHGNAGQGRMGSFFFDFGVDGTFVLRNPSAIWPGLPRFVGVNFAAVSFHGTGAIESGTGRFAGASGNLTTDGPAVAWNADVFPPSGRFNDSITGSICDLGPKTIAVIRPLRVAPKVASDSGQACSAFKLFEYFDGTKGSVNVTLGTQPVPFDGITNEAIFFGTTVGNVTFGTETLRFHFTNGDSFDLVAQWETIGDPSAMARVNGVGNITNGTGVFAGASGHLTYHGPFAAGPSGEFTFLDLAYRGQVCKAK